MKKLAHIARRIVLAATFVPLAPIDQQSTSKLSGLYASSGGDLTGFVNALFKFAISIGAILAVLRIAYAGYLYMGQSDMWSSKGKAKEIIGDVTLGLLLLLAIYLILFQINPDIVKLTALKNIQPLPKAGTTIAPTSLSPAEETKAINDATGGSLGCDLGAHNVPGVGCVAD